MELTFSKINGTNKHINYNVLEESIKSRLEDSCKKAEVIILNNFPVAVSSQSNIDVLILVNIPNIHNSYYKVFTQNDEKVYIKNQIIAVSIIDEYYNSNIAVQGNSVEIDDAMLSFNDNASKIKWGLINYLAGNCKLNRKYINVQPLIWLKNNSSTKILPNTIIGNNFSYDHIENALKADYAFKWPGYKDWHTSDILFEVHIKKIVEQASLDSQEGYLTRRKIDRIQDSFDEASKKAYENLGKKLLEVNGKAGTGKSSDILKWMLQHSLKGNRGVFLTYNHLLVYDITVQIKSFENRIANTVKKASTTTNTIHGYFYNVAKKLGVLLLLTEQRIKELSDILDNRIILIQQYFKQINQNEPGISLSKLKFYVQTKWIVNEGLKREAILFLKYIDKEKFFPLESELIKHFKTYRDDKVEKLANLESSNVFLKDYPEVLKRILQATTNLDAFLKDLDVASKYELLANTLDLKRSILESSGSKKIDFEKLKTRFKKGISGFRAGRLVYVDEAQDCHQYERDILVNLFGSQNIVIANGDKEQLIRYSELCDWHISQGKPIDFYRYSKKRKSFRMKPAIASLANHIANWYGIDLDIEPLDTEDHGSIVIDVTTSIDNHLNTIKEFLTIGDRQGCSAYESVLLLKPAESDQNGFNNEIDTTSVSVNEFNNIVKDNNKFRSGWDLVEKANKEITDVIFWNSTGNVDKKTLGIPQSLSVRSIYYESCRGIEAWSVMCFNLDAFFELRKKDDEADNYLLNDLFDQITSEKRCEMYAATWVLMAVTRSIENCYIQITNKQSSFYQCMREYAINNKNFIRVIR